MRKLFLIPARKGSKGLPGKNLLTLNNKPMIEYALEAALEAKNTDDVICVSTDDDKIIENANKLGITVPFKRPKHLATDKSGMLDAAF